MNTPAEPYRLRKAWEVRVESYDEADIFYAATQGKARSQAYRALSDMRDVRIVDISARRAPWRDMRLPVLDPIVERLSEEERHCLLHAFGGNSGDPIKAGYRDYFYTRVDDPPLVELAGRGLMSIQLAGQMPIRKEGSETSHQDMANFILTSWGKRVALSMVPEYRT